MTDCGGRSWTLNERNTKEYTALCSKNSGSETRKRIEQAVSKHATATEKDVTLPLDPAEEVTETDNEKNLEACHTQIIFYDELITALLHGEASVKSMNLIEGHNKNTYKHKTGNIECYFKVKKAI